MQKQLEAFGYSEAQIKDALKHCRTIEEAIVYLPAVPVSARNNYESNVPDAYVINHSDDEVIDLVDDDSSSESSESESDGDVEMVEGKDHVHFRGDTLFTNRISELHHLSDGRYVNFFRLFSKSMSLKHDDDISHIILTSFVYDDGILDDLVGRHPKAEITFARHVDPDVEPSGLMTFNDGRLVIVSPPLGKVFKMGCFHAKLILIRFSDRLRIVISSANLFHAEWQMWSQCVWMQDFFNAPEGEKRVADKKLDMEFRTQLIHFLRKCSIPEERIFNIIRNIFFKNLRVQLVTSIAETVKGPLMDNYGHMRLRSILKGLYDYFDKYNPISTYPPVLSQCTSIGSPSKNWIAAMLQSCHGNRPLPADMDICDALHVVFPTSAYVNNSIIGTDMAGSLIFKRKTYQTKVFLKKMLKRYRDAPGRETTLAHSKYLMNVPMKDHPKMPWVYAGSHNFTKSAWGQLEKGDSQITMYNYECGVVLLPKNYVDYYNGDFDVKNRKAHPEDDSCNPIDLTFGAPCLPYRSDDRPFLVDYIVCCIM